MPAVAAVESILLQVRYAVPRLALRLEPISMRLPVVAGITTQLMALRAMPELVITETAGALDREAETQLARPPHPALALPVDAQRHLILQAIAAERGIGRYQRQVIAKLVVDIKALFSLLQLLLEAAKLCLLLIELVLPRHAEMLGEPTAELRKCRIAIVALIGTVLVDEDKRHGTQQDAAVNIVRKLFGCHGLVVDPERSQCVLRLRAQYHLALR